MKTHEFEKDREINKVYMASKKTKGEVSRCLFIGLELEDEMVPFFRAWARKTENREPNRKNRNRKNRFLFGS
jgi:hypothetical protein